MATEINFWHFLDILKCWLTLKLKLKMHSLSNKLLILQNEIFGRQIRRLFCQKRGLCQKMQCTHFPKGNLCPNFFGSKPHLKKKKKKKGIAADAVLAPFYLKTYF